jgi:hypothetical protein
VVWAVGMSSRVKANGGLTATPSLNGGDLAAIPIWGQGRFAVSQGMITTNNPLLFPVVTITAGALPPNLALVYNVGTLNQSNWIIQGTVANSSRGQSYVFTLTATYTATGTINNPGLGTIMGTSSADFVFNL